MVQVPEGYNCLVYDEVDSTNSQAKRLSQEGKLSGPTWIRANRQTAGRGRQGRTWQSASGNLMCSLAMNSRCAPAELAQLSFVTALAVRDAIANIAPELNAELKWPNDVLLEGAKVSGILLESFPTPQPQETCLVIGIGVNLADFPKDTPYPATSVGERAGKTVDPDTMLEHLSFAFAKRHENWMLQGFSAVRQDWLAHAWNWRKPIRVRLPSEELHGTFADIDEAGALILQLPNGAIRTITAGDVFF